MSLIPSTTVTRILGITLFMVGSILLGALLLDRVVGLFPEASIDKDNSLRISGFGLQILGYLMVMDAKRMQRIQ